MLSVTAFEICKSAFSLMQPKLVDVKNGEVEARKHVIATVWHPESLYPRRFRHPILEHLAIDFTGVIERCCCLSGARRRVFSSDCASKGLKRKLSVVLQ